MSSKSTDNVLHKLRRLSIIDFSLVIDNNSDSIDPKILIITGIVASGLIGYFISRK